MSETSQPTPDIEEHHEPLPTPFSKALLLFLNLFLVLFAYYHVKPAKASLVIEYSGATSLPWIWIATAFVLFMLMPFYQMLLKKYGRYYVTQAASLLFVGSMVLFWFLMRRGEIATSDNPDGFAATSVIFYILVDIFSVLLVEQFWSLSDSVFKAKNAKKWFWLIASGGLLGGAAGGWASTLWLNYVGFATEDLLLIAGAVIGFVALVSVYLAHHSFYDKNPLHLPKVAQSASWKVIKENNYLLLIAIILLLAQLAQPIVDYQFMTLVEAEFTERNERTEFLSGFWGTLSFIAMLINLAITPVIHRYFGVLAGLLVQPILLIFSSIAFAFSPTFIWASFNKGIERGLSWSINRASRELLYVPIDPNVIYQAKGWIDVFGYRAFKIFGSGVILLCTEVFNGPVPVSFLAILVVAICIVRIMMMVMVGKRYKQLLEVIRQGKKKSKLKKVTVE